MKKFALIGISFFLPAIALAQSSGETVDSVQDLASFVIRFINNILVPLVFAIAFLVFIWGVFKYFIQGASDPEKRSEGAKVMLYGIIGFFVMISVWGLVHILTGSIRLNNYTPSQSNDLPDTPGIQVQ